MSDLLPCPFCGSKADVDTIDYGAVLSSEEGKIYESITCSNEGCFFYQGVNMGYMTATHWNTRAPYIQELEAERDRLREQLAGKWIAVVDELPEKEGMYLCLFDDGIMETFYYEGGELWGSTSISFVTHWQPLPTPPVKQE